MLVCGVSVASLALSLAAGATLADNIVALSASGNGTTPCGIAVPNVRSFYMLTFTKDHNPFDQLPMAFNQAFDLGTDTISTDVKRALCKHDNVFDVLKDLFGKSDTPLKTEGDVKNLLCSIADDGAGDPLVRVQRAYLLSATAFARYKQENSSTTGKCRDELTPFHEDEEAGQYCANGDRVLSELVLASDNMPIYGADGAMPEVQLVLYRLAALSVLAHETRRGSDGGKGCFGNGEDGKQQWADASKLCAAVFDTTGANAIRATMGQTGGNGEDAFAKFYKSVPTCKEGVNTDEIVTYDIDYADSSTLGDRRQCERQHAFALYDTHSLYGLPDFYQSVNFDVGSAPYSFYSSLMESWYVEHRESTAAERDAVHDIMMYTRAWVAISLFWVVASVQIACYWTVWAAAPLLALFARKLCIRNDRSGPSERRPFNLVRGVASIATLFLFLWICIVHPFPSPTTLMPTDDCENYASTGAVHGTTSGTSFVALTIGSALVAAAVFSLVHFLMFRTERTQYTNSMVDKSLELLALLAAVTVVVVDGIVVRRSLDDWITHQASNGDDPADRAANDVRGIIASASGAAIVVSSISQSHFFAKRVSIVVLWALGTAIAAWLDLFVKASFEDNDTRDADWTSTALNVVRIILTVCVGGQAIWLGRFISKSNTGDGFARVGETEKPGSIPNLTLKFDP